MRLPVDEQLGRLPRRSLVDAPTPVRALAEGLWCKDDGRCALRYGGNKARKLEFLLGDAAANGVTDLLTVGAIGSNHALATAIHGSEAGFRVHVLHFPQPMTAHVQQNLRAIRNVTADLALVPSPALLPWSVAKQRAKFLATGVQAYWIPGGGSSAIGSLGYVLAGLEFGAQVQAGVCPLPGSIHVAAGTVGTLAGLVLGLALAGIANVEVVGVRVTDRIVCNPLLVRRLMREALAMLTTLGISAPSQFPRWRICSRYFAPGYGRASAAAEHGVAQAARFNLTLEMTYTGRAFASAYAAHRLATERPVLYWHTLNQQPLDGLLDPVRPASDYPAAYGPYL